MGLLSNLSIPGKTYSLFGLMLALLIGVSASLILVFNDINAGNTALLTRETPAVVEAMRIRGDLQNVARQMNNVLLVAQPPQGIDALEQSINGLAAGIHGSIARIEATGRSAEVLPAIKDGIPKLEQTAAATIAVKRAGAADHDARSRETWGGPNGRPLVLKLYENIAHYADDEMRNIVTTTQHGAERRERAVLFAVLAVALGSVLAAGLCFLVASVGIARPLARLQEVMGRMAAQDLQADIPGTARGDEVGAMAKAVQVFKDNALSMRRMEAEAVAQNEAAEAVKQRAEAEREAAAGRLAQTVEGLASGLAQLAKGNLTFAINAAFAPEYERLRVDFNAAISGLQHTVQEIMSHSQAIGVGTGEIANATDDLAKRTEQQAASLEQTAAALDEITATVRQTASGSGRAEGLAQSASTEAERSASVVNEAVAAMGEIEGSARQIGQIISVIDEIAFQTNLLALNAGVEAARAGEAGRGFAVVASEVRALAQRAAEAAKEIKALITTSMQQVERGVRLVGETGTALGRIQTSVIEINSAIKEIAASAQEQASGLAEVNSAVNQMDKVTQQNAAMVEESTAAAHALSRETEALNRAIANFEVDAKRAGHAVAREPSGRPARRPAASGQAALKVVESAAAENWDSF